MDRNYLLLPTINYYEPVNSEIQSNDGSDLKMQKRLENAKILW